VARSASPKMPSKLNTARMVPAFMLRAFWDELDRRGVSPSELERLSGVSRPRSGDCSTSISVTDMYSLFEACQVLSGDETVGLSVGRAVGALGFHLVGHLALASATLSEALELVARVQPQIRDRPLYFEERADGAIRLGFAVRDGQQRPGARVEAELTAVLTHDVALHFFVDVARELPRVELPFPAPADLSPYQSVFPGGVEFDREGTFVCFHRSSLARRRSGADSGLLEQLLNLALEHYVPVNTVDEWTGKVRHALRTQPALRQLDAGALAKQLGVSVRGLSRRLAREGASLTS